MAEKTLVLLGDSILDNAPYTEPEPDSTFHLQQMLPDWTVERLARDGATMSSVAAQLGAMRGRPDAAVLSVGGNDAIEHIGLLNRPATSSPRFLGELLEVADDFGRRYEAVARLVAEHADRTILCTIYEVRLEPIELARLARVPLALLNDRIVRIGARMGIDVLELRSVCTEPGDFVLEIEPSAHGALKIARAIAGLLSADQRLSSARLFAAGPE